MKENFSNPCIEFSFISIMEFSIPLDATDWRLLDLLQADASLTNHALAQAAHVSPATALRRVRRLREAGVIERFTALLGAPLAGQGLQVLCEVVLDRQGAEHLDAFETGRWTSRWCSSAGACRRGRISCWWSGRPTCPPSRP
jgi:hypothetical protein